MEYQYTLYYECGGCNGQIALSMLSENPDVPTKTARQQATQHEVWCEDCDWHGPVEGLTYIRMTDGSWLPL